MKKIIIFSLITFSFFCGGDLSAQLKGLKTDTSEVEVRKPASDFFDIYKNDKNFIYDRAENPEGLWDIIKAWFNNMLRKILGSDGFFVFRKYFGYIIILAALVIVVYVLRKTRLSGVLYNKDEKSIKNYKEHNEDITKINPDDLITDALKRKDYRTAVRYYYLKNLKLMTNKGIIDWKIDKTNQQYLNEINEFELKKSFARLTGLFEWIWYGDFRIEEKYFEETIRFFDEFSLAVAERK